MAKEIKSISVAPSEEEETINVWQSFGWEFRSTQEVKTSDSSHLERRGDTIYSVTQAGDHYVKLTFERDPTRENYSELVALEKQYNAVPGPGYKPVLFGKIWLIVAGFFLLAGFGGLIGSSSGFDGTTIFCFTVVGGVVIWRIMRYIKKEKQWETDYDNWKNERTEILAKAKTLS